MPAVLQAAVLHSVAVAIWTGLGGVGTLLGQVMAGLVGPVWGWRIPFVITAIPALLVALLVLRTEEPQRGRQEEALQSKVGQARGLCDGLALCGVVLGGPGVVARIQCALNTALFQILRMELLVSQIPC